MKDELLLKEMSRIYHSMECLHNIEKAYAVGDLFTCRILADLYPKFSEVRSEEQVGLGEAYDVSSRVKAGKELLFWCEENVKPNLLWVINDEHMYWLGIFKKVCKEFVARFNYDATTITVQMQRAFFDDLWCLMACVKTSDKAKIVVSACENVFVKATDKMMERWSQYVDDSTKDEPLGVYVFCMTLLMQERGCSDEEISNFFKRMDIGLDVC